VPIEGAESCPPAADGSAEWPLPPPRVAAVAVLVLLAGAARAALVAAFHRWMKSILQTRQPWFPVRFGDWGYWGTWGLQVARRGGRRGLRISLQSARAPAVGDAAAKGEARRVRWTRIDSAALTGRVSHLGREALYRQAQEIFKREAPWVPLAHAVVLIATRTEVTGFKIDPLGRHPFEGRGSGGVEGLANESARGALHLISTMITCVGVSPTFSPICVCASDHSRSPALNSRIISLPSGSVIRRLKGATA
jgi:hypothetical protein